MTPRLTSYARGVRAIAILVATAFALFGALNPVVAQETISYSYDSLGRLVKVDHGTTGPNAGVTATYTYDKADNRTQVLVSGGSGTTTITLSPTTLPNGTVSTAYSSPITASGGASPYTFSSTGTLPAGLTLNSTTGTLAGTPTAVGTSNFTVTATDSAGLTGSQAYTVSITAPTTITLSPVTLPGGTVGAAYSSTITPSGGTAPYTFTSTGTLPAGLTFGAGLLSGTPTAKGTSTFTITATDSAGNSGSSTYSVTISPANDLTFTPATLPSGTVGTAYSSPITASGGTSPYSFTSTGTLPAGLTLTSAGTLSGTPTTAKAYSFTVNATDSAGNHTGSKTYSVTINPSSTLTLSATFPAGTVGKVYTSTSITVTGGTGPYTFTKTGTVPPGLALSTAGALSGTPTTAGSYTFTATAKDSTGNHVGSKSFTVTVGAAANVCSGVSFAVGDAVAVEGGDLLFQITKTGTTSSSCSVNFATADGTATAPLMYTARSGTLTFLSGTTQLGVDVTTNNPGQLNSSETMFLNLSAATGGATITDAQGRGLIEPSGIPPGGGLSSAPVTTDTPPADSTGSPSSTDPSTAQPSDPTTTPSASSPSTTTPTDTTPSPTAQE